MENIFEIIETLKEVGVPKATTIEILHELIDNGNEYMTTDDVNNLLKEKLEIDSYIALLSHFKLGA